MRAHADEFRLGAQSTLSSAQTRGFARFDLICAHDRCGNRMKVIPCATVRSFTVYRGMPLIKSFVQYIVDIRVIVGLYLNGRFANLI